MASSIAKEPNDPVFPIIVDMHDEGIFTHKGLSLRQLFTLAAMHAMVKSGASIIRIADDAVLLADETLKRLNAK